MPWKFAVQSIAWGHQSLDVILREAKAAGYCGLELFQHPGDLGGPRAIHDAFVRADLHLVGVTCGSFDERCVLVREIAKLRHVGVGHPLMPYVYTDEWRDAAPRFQDALAEGFRVALHPHMYKPVQTMAEAEAILARHPNLSFLPDTAHLKIAGDDAVEAVVKHFSRIEAIHLKDWREDVGRSYQFYARGFCEMGEGNVDLAGVLGAAFRETARERSDTTRWVVIEQDRTSDPFASAKRSFDWLRAFEARYAGGPQP